MQPQDVVTVSVVTNAVEAELVANTLRAEGIACTIEGDGRAGVVGNVEVHVLVHAWDADRARKVLKGNRDVAAPRSKGRSRKLPKKSAARAAQTRVVNGARRKPVVARARRGVSPTRST